MNHRTASRAFFGLALAVCIGGTSLHPWPASAEQAWVRNEIRLNIRTGPSVENRIVGVVKTGDAVQVLQRGEGWTKIRMLAEDGKDGWIPEGYLDPQAPPGIRLEEAETKTAVLEAELARVTKRAGELSETNEILASQDGEQEAQLKSLTLENMELKAGARYPEWITGALIFASGMLLGAILRSSFARRTPQRVRL